MKLVLILINGSNYINSRPFLQLQPTVLYSQHQVLHKDNSRAFSIFLSLRSRSVAWQPGGRRLPIGSDGEAGTMPPHSGQIAVRLSFWHVRTSNTARRLVLPLFIHAGIKTHSSARLQTRKNILQSVWSPLSPQPNVGCLETTQNLAPNWSVWVL